LKTRDHGTRHRPRVLAAVADGVDGVAVYRAPADQWWCLGGRWGRRAGVGERRGLGVVGVNDAHACTGVPVASPCALWRVTGHHWARTGRSVWCVSRAWACTIWFRGVGRGEMTRSCTLGLLRGRDGMCTSMPCHGMACSVQMVTMACTIPCLWCLAEYRGIREVRRVT
jgi:hypothetical protein